MSNFTAADVKRLRELTGAGMLDCKKALEESDGDFDKAVEILRVKGAKDVGKRAGRTAANGLIAHTGPPCSRSTARPTSWPRTPTSSTWPSAWSSTSRRTAGRVEALLGSTLADGRTVAATVEEQSAKIGEKLVVNRFAVLDGQVAVYLHRKSPDLPPAVGVMVQYSGKSDEAGEADARGVAMQIAAMRPKYLTRDEVPEDVIVTERRIAEEAAREEGKPRRR
jgi:Translation elongation factor Ts